MSDDSKLSKQFDNTESTVEVDKYRLLQKIHGDRDDDISSHQTQQLPVIKPEQDRTEETVQMQKKTLQQKAVGQETAPQTYYPLSPEDAATTNFAVPDALLEEISNDFDSTNEQRWETMDIVLEEIHDEPKTILDQPVIDAMSSIAYDPNTTAPLDLRIEFHAFVDHDGTIRLPKKYLETGQIRPGMRLKIVAYPE